MKTNPPGENDIMEVLDHLDQDKDGEVSKSEFLSLMGLVITSMLESELYLQNQLHDEEEGHKNKYKQCNHKHNVLSVNLLDRLMINVHDSM